ncbi:MAG: hypothetical protein IPM54_38450 [Polyangiaceae bacterium]|nr:hypothetical protein [Polyangiaceae bacterium]
MTEAAVPKKLRKTKRIKREEPVEAPLEAPEGQIERTADVSALTQHGWVAGVIGSVAVLALGYIGSRINVLDKGWGLPIDVTPNKSTSAIFALVVVAAIMFVVELTVRLRVEKGKVLSIPDEIREKRYADFAFRCVKIL